MEKKKRWNDNTCIKESTGMDFAISTGAAVKKEDRKELLRSHLWCLNDIARLWDR